MKKLNWLKTVGAVCALLMAAAITAPAQSFKTLYSFCAQYGCPDGATPQAGLVQGTDGTFYGSTQNDGPNGSGEIFKISPRGILTTVLGVGGTELSDVNTALTLGTDGNFYGVSQYGGNHGSGTVFKLTPAGVLTTLYSFCQNGGCTDGANPQCTLVQGTDGNFYGTTIQGGTDGYGIVFKMTPSGTVTTLHFFDYADGQNPVAGLVLATNGEFYGTTMGGGANGQGTVFEITPSGALTTLHSFTGGVDGSSPRAALVQGANGNLYGTAPYGGEHSDGDVFEITPEGTFTTLYSFCPESGCADGSSPMQGLIQGSDGNLYGTTPNGGGDNCGGGCGVVFKLTPGGTETVLHTFVHTDGDDPMAGLVQGTNGLFYGTTVGGGANNSGSIFSLAVPGLGPFVETVPTAGRTGRAVMILGPGLEGTTSVTFNATPSTFKVISGSLISAIVPAGATTGPVQVVTPSGTLTSNVNFQVLP